MSLREPLQRLHDTIRETMTKVETLVEGLSDEQLQWRPGPDRWSVAEVVEHLSNTAEPYLDRIDPALERGRARGLTSERTAYRYGAFWRWFAKAAGPEGTNRTAPKIFRPRGGGEADASSLTRAEVAPRFREIHERLLAAVNRADGLDLARVRHGNPLLPLVRQPVGASFEILAGHMQRHLAQIQRLCDHAELPRPAAV